jgi:hypothetical protein
MPTKWKTLFYGHLNWYPCITLWSNLFVVTEDRDRWRAFVSTVMNHGFHKVAGILLTTWATIQILKKVCAAYTVRISRERPCEGGGGKGVDRGASLLLSRLKGLYWCKTVWRTRELHYYIQTESSECNCTVYCGCCDNVLHWITRKLSEHMKAYCLLFVQWLWNKCFQDD